MTVCNSKSVSFPAVKSRKVEAEFSGGEVTSDGGILLVERMDRKLGLVERVAKCIADPRNPDMVEHSVESLLQQRVYGICQGYEDLNDHTFLRKDTGFQTAVGRDENLGSASTLCRLESWSNRSVAWETHKILLDTFIASFKEPPKELILDFDPTDDLIHGNQEKAFFHGYYGNYCFLPLYVFCGEQLLVSYLRSSNIDGAKHAWAILKFLVKIIRQSFPDVKIIFRGDSGFCRRRMLSWCERNNVEYIVGIAQNKRLLARAADKLKEAEELFQKTQQKQRLFSEFEYAADSWTKQRRIIAKAEHTDKGSNPRFVITTLSGDPLALYDDVYCARGEMENRIKEQQLDLFADRTSCHEWWPNQFRLLLSSLAYVLLESIRRLALPATELAKATCGTIRLKLLKIGAVILRNTRRVRFLLSSHYPFQTLFLHVARQLSSD